MRNLHELNQWRCTDKSVLRVFGGVGDETCGVFNVPSCIDRAPLICIASTGLGWDHVSVSRKKRTPNWREMDQIFRLFFLPTEAAMQLHVPPSEHINDMGTCLHIWRSHDREIPRPPFFLSGDVISKPPADLASN